ncbi:hypothetical protein SLE2022_121800 [Rubroshorea leprosula]
MGRGTRGASSSRQLFDPSAEAQRQLHCLIQGLHRAISTQQQMPKLSQPPSQQQLSSLTQLPIQQQQQPTVIQSPMDYQNLGDDAAMEEEATKRNLEVELDAEFGVLDRELDALLEKELSHAMPKTGCGMDKGDDAPANSS